MDRNAFAAPAQGAGVAHGGEATTSKGQFAVVNGSELLERLAYYGIVSVNGLYLKSLGHSTATIGLLSAILLPLPYIVPLLTGAIAEKVGYKPTMLAAFVAYASGFLLMAAATGLPLLIVGIVLLGLGAGMFKPLTAASIAHVTSPAHRSMGYNLYYMGINVGGFLGPVLIALLGTDYRLAFTLGAGIMLADFLLIALLFRNPVPPKRDTKLLGAFRPLAEVLRDRPFIVLLAIFAGFWFLYSMNFSFLTLYLDRFVPKPAWFDANLQQAIDPAFVILLGIPLGRLAARGDPVRWMTLGIALSAAGFLLLGLVATFPALVAGIIISTAGEVLAYPGFLSYVSRIAPRDRVAVYQGYGFLPIFAGFFLGPLVGGWLYGAIAEEQGRPALFWALMVGVGVLTVSAFLLYAHLLTPRAERKRAGLPAALAVLLLVPLLVLAGVAAGTQSSAASPPLAFEAATFAQRDGSTTEGQTTTVAFAIPADAAQNVTVRLTWFDPVATLPGATNQPDTFALTLLDAQGHRVAAGTATNPVGTAGSVVLVVPAATFHGNVTAQVTLVSAGDTTFAGNTVTADTDNEWSLRATGRVPAATS